MKTKIGRISATIAATIVLQLLMSVTAFAHTVSIQAYAKCVSTQAIIYYTVKGDGDAFRVDVELNGKWAAGGQFNWATNNTFTGSIVVPADCGNTVTVSAVVVGAWNDNRAAGESASVTVDIPVCNAQKALSLGRFTGGANSIDLPNGVRITGGLTIHCDLKLSNNLQLNWGGNRFHMTEHLTTSQCSDDPFIEQRPPKALIDTLIGTGIGRYNGMDGYTIEFKLVDAGEPGRDDRMAFKIYQTSNPANIVLPLTGDLSLLKGGNLQAHMDQPHKR